MKRLFPGFVVTLSLLTPLGCAPADDDAGEEMEEAVEETGEQMGEEMGEEMKEAGEQVGSGGPVVVIEENGQEDNGNGEDPEDGNGEDD